MDPKLRSDGKINGDRVSTEKFGSELRAFTSASLSTSERSLLSLQTLALLQIHPETGFSQDFFNEFFALFALTKEINELNKALKACDYSAYLESLDPSSALYRKFVEKGERQINETREQAKSVLARLNSAIESLKGYPEFLTELLEKARQSDRIKPAELLALVHEDLGYFERLIKRLVRIRPAQDADPFSPETNRALRTLARYVKLAGVHIYGEATWSEIHGNDRIGI